MVDRCDRRGSGAGAGRAAVQADGGRPHLDDAESRGRRRAVGTCYDDAEANCRRYGRLYTWASAQRACPTLGDGWRLPTNDEWRGLAAAYGGLREETADKGRAAYDALIAGGRSGFEAVFGGGRAEDGQYARGDAHGFYWTASETGPATAWFYNLGRNGLSVNRHATGEKSGAFAIRCVRD